MYSRCLLTVFIVIAFTYVQSVDTQILKNSLATDILYITDKNSVVTYKDYQNVIDITSKIREFQFGQQDEDIHLDIEALLQKYNKPVENHEVKTVDGYILKMFRIPSKGQVVMLMHGLLASADDFVTPGPEYGLAYILSDQGYDVWMGNARGNKHSRNHEYLKPSNPKFWNFSWHEVGVSDLPAMIDYVIYETGHKSITYIGHSQGTTAFFACASETLECNEKISLMVALSPVVFIANTKSLAARIASNLVLEFENLLNLLKVYELFPSNNVTKTILNIFCGTEELAELFCSNISFLVCGFDPEQQNLAKLPVFYGHLPAGSSIKQIRHYGQIINSGRFAKYDYGADINMKFYGISKPPEYNLSQITAPIYLFYSEDDWIAQPVDVKKLSKKLKRLIGMYNVPNQKFNHLDFLFAKDVKTLVYEKLLSVLLT